MMSDEYTHQYREQLGAVSRKMGWRLVYKGLAWYIRGLVAVYSNKMIGERGRDCSCMKWMKQDGQLDGLL